MYLLHLTGQTVKRPLDGDGLEVASIIVCSRMRFKSTSQKNNGERKLDLICASINYGYVDISEDDVT